MTIDDVSAFSQAHHLIRNRRCPGLVPTANGISAAYFNAVQAARRVYQESVGAFVPLFAGCKYGLSRTYFLVGDTPLYFIDLKARKHSPKTPPASCYRIHLTTPDPEGDPV